MSKNTLNYADCGVDIDAGNAFVGRIKAAVASTRRAEVLSGLGGFGGLFRADFSSMQEPVLVSATDGVGTKLLLLQEHDRAHIAGIDAVAMCVNDLAAQGAEPLFFLDYLATGALQGETMAAVVEGIAEACRVCSCSLIGGETAEMPGMYSPGEYDIGGFAVGVVDRSRIIDGHRIGEGDVIIGLASSGVHSNGYSMVRRLLDMGKADLANDVLSDGHSAIDAVLAATRLYVPAVKALMQKNVDVHGFSHITGGGFYDNLERILPDGLAAEVDVQAWDKPAVFDYLLSFAEVSATERYRTFNMGIGFVAMIAKEDVEKTLHLLQEVGETAYILGSVTQKQKHSVVLHGLC